MVVRVRYLGYPPLGCPSGADGRVWRFDFIIDSDVVVE
jgi:hypothetical protein